MNDLLSVEWRAIDAVYPYAGNPRTIPQAAVQKVASSIKTYGWRQPIVVDEAGVILAGHTRYLAAKRLRRDAVPVHVAIGLTAAQARAYRLADNRTAQETSWDEAGLTFELGELKLDGFDLDLTGFDFDELAMMLPDASDPGALDELPPTPEDPVSAPGDLWILGDHRIICGDSTDAATVQRLLGTGRPKLMVTDPPYGVEYDAAWRGEAKSKSGKRVSLGVHAKGKVLNDDRADWRDAWALFPGDVAYVWHAGLKAAAVIESLAACKFEIRSQIIWAKNQLVIGRGHYHPQHEPCLYAVRRGGTGHWAGDRKQTTLWSIAKPQRSETGHSTQKPVECMARPIRNNSRTGDLIYEPFSGSGTTIVACETEGRACRAVELNPAYVDVAVQRWQVLTGETAMLDGSGETYDVIAQQRGKKREAA